MDPTQTSVIVALIPNDCSWCKVDPPHMTLVYVGETTNLRPSTLNELAKDVASIAALSNTVLAKVTGKDVFGVAPDKVDVFTIASTPEILAIRRMLEAWDTSDFPSFEPHVTLGPEGTWPADYSSYAQPMPMYLTFDRIMVIWGTEQLPFWLKKY